MTTALRYPPARWVGGATTYGPLPDHGRTSLSLILHTTETVGMPGFSDGDTAPHLVYDTRNAEWTQWADLNRYVGTMKGHSTGHWNCQAVQVEILGYSDQSVCPPNGWWVGELANEHLADLAQLFAWLMDQGVVRDELHAEPPGGWKYGTGSPYRMNQQQFDLFSGLSAHGGVGGNSHWDTGVLDLAQLWAMATDGTLPPPTEPVPPPDQEGAPMWPMYYTDGFNSPSGNGRTAWRDNVMVLQHLVNRAGGSVDEDGLLGNDTLRAVDDLVGNVDQTITGTHHNELVDLLPDGGGAVPKHTHQATTTISET